MPALYAHNKFGKLVIPKLPSTIKETVRKYPNEFRMGLQGPDFLFFYLTRKDITKIGVTMHHSDVYPFMEHAASSLMVPHGTCRRDYKRTWNYQP